MQKILIIHPEGNIFNNPNLYSIIIFLSKNYLIDILIPKISINENLKFKEKNINIIEYNTIFTEYKLFNDLELLNFFIGTYITSYYSLCIGVDRLGLLLSNTLFILNNIPYGFISYEILFEEETSKQYKEIEIISSKNVSFAIIQDKNRALELEKENKIDLSKSILIPVAGTNTFKYQKKFLLHTILNIQRNKKILLFIGSISNWAGSKIIIENLNLVPDDWVIVFHDRYGNSKEKLQNLCPNVNFDENKVYFSNYICETNNKMKEIIHSADLGLVLYYPDYSNVYTGKNLEYVGLSSGKFSTFLQNGLPIISNHAYLFDYISSYKIGYYLHDIKELNKILTTFKSNENFECITFFDKILNFKNFQEKLLNTIQKTISTHKREISQTFKEDLELFTKKYTDYNCNINLLFSAKYNKFYNQILNLKESKYILYGYGTIGKTIQAMIPNKIIGYIDINTHPNNLININYDKIIVSVLGREEEIIKYLITELNIERKKIITINL